ncbi:PEP/pyruvate-binding domain-containing protein [Propionimicrobium sp. PCR01-08-3]|uniref:PEP/pyruvate-binding domain-containing protein n=1 Tax=Propionimicrobium sp. PCR01-08-3 TaxID=3052086 RepID=UPI00255CE614|nr:PEP/pyruvate-binding domain-containing protein [Propionimicrobium sp. PCR01-08-3]WIY82654.1 PEP/pyruvate-binding domain-containing protein [Propionimicrobium sp. PCR01-08-3]
MESYNRASTGITGLDRIFDGLRLGDNVVWQVDSLSQYRDLIQPFAERAQEEGRRLVYFRFGSHAPLLDDLTGVEVVKLDASLGFENFASAVHNTITEKGFGAFYVFDLLTSLLFTWRSDLAVGNFFKVTCPYLFDMDTVAYFGLIRREHTFATLAMIRDTTQLLLDVYLISGDTYVHPLKVWLRHSPTMFFPHLLNGDEANPITSSETTARLFAAASHRIDPPDHWQRVVQQGWAALDSLEVGVQREAKDELIDMFIGREGRVVELCRSHATLADLLTVAMREIGTGYIGGKSVGMIVANAILDHDSEARFTPRMEQNDSYFLGSDLFYTYIIANGWWKLWVEQKSQDGYFTAGASLNRKLATGRFPPAIREQFLTMLEYFGQSPIIARSSSLLEDNFGNAFAGKYESVFCANQGTPEERLHALEDAVRTVYASAMSNDALEYRRNRGLDTSDEQMAILVQRVSGDHHEGLFFPHAAGVGNSSNFYVWDPSIDPDAGMLRLVLGLGTRAVDRTIADHAKLVTLDDPTREVDATDKARNTQRYVDVMSLDENRQLTMALADIRELDIKADWDLFLSTDTETLRWLRENNRPIKQIPKVLDFHGLIERTDFAPLMRDILAKLSQAYDYPVDIEYTVNINESGEPRINLLQCRPLQTRGLGHAIAMPSEPDPAHILFSSHGNFMGGNVRLPLDHVVMVRPDAYLALGQRDRYAVARGMGVVNKALADASFMIMAPGRWGTTSPSLGIPVHFTEISNAAVMAEFTYPAGGFIPELSQGSHFFQDLVESGIFYVAIFDQRPEVSFAPGLVTEAPNRLTELAPDLAGLANVLHVARTDDLVIYSDIASQQVICC